MQLQRKNNLLVKFYHCNIKFVRRVEQCFLKATGKQYTLVKSYLSKKYKKVIRLCNEDIANCIKNKKSERVSHLNHL